MKIGVELVYALANEQTAILLQLDEGCTVADALAISGIRQACPDLDSGRFTLGIWGREVAPTRILEDGDRVEIYRPLTADPKRLRRERAQAQASPRRKKG